MSKTTGNRIKHRCYAFSIPWVCTSTSPSSSSTCSSSGSSCSRRQFLNFSATTLLCTVLPSLTAMNTGRVAAQAGEVVEEKLRSFDSVQQIEGVASQSVSFDTFVRDIEAKSIKQVFFFGNQNQTCFYERPDGSLLRVTDGFPTENPRNSESPFWVMAKIRDLYV